MLGPSVDVRNVGTYLPKYSGCEGGTTEKHTDTDTEDEDTHTHARPPTHHDDSSCCGPGKWGTLCEYVDRRRAKVTLPLSAAQAKQLRVLHTSVLQPPGHGPKSYLLRIKIPSTASSPIINALRTPLLWNQSRNGEMVQKTRITSEWRQLDQARTASEKPRNQGSPPAVGAFFFPATHPFLLLFFYYFFFSCLGLFWIASRNTPGPIKTIE